MPKTYPDAYFQNQIEQAQIRLALTEAIPTGVYYHNLIMALTEMLRRAVQEEYKEEVFEKWEEPKKQAKSDAGSVVKSTL